MRFFVAMLLSFCLAVSAAAYDPSEVLQNPALEQRARDLSSELRCLVCQNQSIDDSDAPLAKDLRILVRERLTKGDTDAQVKQFIVSRYGEFVLLKPRFGLHTLLLWCLPVALFLAGALLVYRRRKPVVTQTEPDALSAKEKARLKKLLED
jgi:cytochrome c-type biogenesis protein CcmH